MKKIEKFVERTVKRGGVESKNPHTTSRQLHLREGKEVWILRRQAVVLNF
jgi:hypothetical protein